MATESGGLKQILLFSLIVLMCQMAPGQGVGGNGVPGPGSGSGSIPATSNLLKGAGSAGSATAATPGTDYVIPSQVPAVTPSKFGGYGDAYQPANGCNVSASSTTVVCPDGPFISTSVDGGKQFWESGVGAGGSAFNAQIVSVSSSTTATLSAAPAGTINNGRAIYGHDDTTAVQSCFQYSSTNGVGCALKAAPSTGIGLTGFLISSPLQLVYNNSTQQSGGVNAIGSSQVNGTIIFCEVNGECLNVAPGANQGANLTNITIQADQTQPNSRGIRLNPINGPFTNANFTNVSVFNTAQECLWMDGGGGPGYGFNEPVQFTNFYQFFCQGPNQSHAANLIKGTGQIAQVMFIGGAVSGNGWSAGSSSLYPNWLIAMEEKTGGLGDSPSHVTFSGFTYQVGTQGLFIGEGSTSIHFDNGYIEDVSTAYYAYNSLGLTFNGNHIANSGNITALLQYAGLVTGSARDNLEYGGLVLPASFAICSNNTNTIDFGESNKSPVTTTSGCATAQLGPTTSTLNVTGGQTAFVNGSATTITTISAPAISPGKTLTLYAGSSPGFTLAAGGNINLGGLASPLTVPSGSSVVLTLMDLGPTWLVTSGPQIGGLSSNCTGGGCTLQLSPLSAPVTAPGFFPQSGAAGPYSTFFDDFYTGANMANVAIGSPVSSSCSPSNTYTDNNHPGNMLLTSGTGGSGTGILCGLISEANSVTSANTSLGWTWETAVYVPVLPGTTPGAYQAGLAHTPNANPWTTGIGFYLSSANGVANDWYCRYNSTSTDSGVAATVAWTRLTMVNDGTNVHWYIGGTQVCGTGVAIASMPSTTQYPAVWSATALSATSVTMAYDYINWQRAVSR